MKAWTTKDGVTVNGVKVAKKGGEVNVTSSLFAKMASRGYLTDEPPKPNSETK